MAARTWAECVGTPWDCCPVLQAGVNADAISKEDLLNAPGETYTVKLTAPGTYGYYCEPHQGEQPVDHGVGALWRGQGHGPDRH